MPQSKLRKSTSYTHWIEKLGLFQTITPNVPIEKRKIFNNDALFEGVICKDCKLILCAEVYKRLRKCGSCHNVPRNVQSCLKYQTYCFSYQIKAIFFKLRF